MRRVPMKPNDSVSGCARSSSAVKAKLMASIDRTPGRAATSAVLGGPPSCVTVTSGPPPMAAVNASGASAVRRAPAANVRTTPLTTAMTAATSSVGSQRRPTVVRSRNRTALIPIH